MADAQRYNGTVERWVEAKGYGYIRPDEDGERSVFIHARDVCGSGHRTLVVGSAVEYSIGFDDRGRRQCCDLVAIDQAAHPGSRS